MAKTLPFHGSNMGSIPIRCIVGNDRATASPPTCARVGSCTNGLTSSAGEFRRISGLTVIFVC